VTAETQSAPFDRRELAQEAAELSLRLLKLAREIGRKVDTVLCLPASSRGGRPRGRLSRVPRA
jgi:hypothetical protein